MKLETARFITAYKNHDEPYWLSLLGNSGTGKTFLAELSFDTIHPWYEVLAWARNRDMTLAGYERPPKEKFLDLAFRNYMVVIDDIGSEYTTDFARSKLYEFLNRRDRKWTMITANLSLEQIATKLDERIASRMMRHNSVVVEVDTKDYSLRA